MRKIYLVFFFIFHFGSVYSQVDTVKDEIFSLSLEELLKLKISSVSKKSESILETPQTVVVITKEQLIRRGYIDLEQLFHDLPGFDISRGNGTQYSQIYQRGYRSKNTERTVLLIDGVEENDLWSNSVWLSRQYPLSNIERVEIVYGPAATIYGANAFLGVINIVTKTAKEINTENKNLGLNSQFGYGPWNTQFADLSIAGKSKHVSLILTGRVYRSDEQDLSEYPDFDYSLDSYDLNFYKQILKTDNNLVAQTALDLDNEAYYNSPALNGVKPAFSNQTNDYLIYGKLQIDDFIFGFQSFKRDEGYGAWYRDDFELGPVNGGKWVAQNAFYYTKYEKKISERLSLLTFANFKVHQLTGDCEELYYMGYLNKEFSLTDIADTTGGIITLLPMDSIQNPYWHQTWWHTYSQQTRGELRMNYNPHEKINISAGIEFRISHIQGAYTNDTLANPEENAIIKSTQGGNHFFSRDFGLFTQANYSPIKDLNFVVGGRLDDNKIRLSGGYGTVFNPKLAIIYSPINFILKLMYSEAFMDAGYWAKYGTTLGRLLDNPTLQPEKVKNREFSFAWKANDYFYTDLVAYHSGYTGAIGTANVTFIDNEGKTIHTTQHQALGNLSIAGLQNNIYFNYSHYSAYLNYTYTNPYNITDEKIRIGDIATHQVNFGLNAIFFNKLNINLRANWVGEKPTGVETTIINNPYDKIDSYFIINNTVTYNIYKGISAQIVANNIFDNEYFHPGVRGANGTYYAARLPQNRRNIFFKLIIDI